MQDYDNKKTFILRLVKSEPFETFQEFCNRLLITLFPADFTEVRAWGPKWDMKNDWYCYIERRYFQAHTSRNETIAKQKNKISEDLEWCIKQWSDVKEWVYITNEANTGELENHLDSLRWVYPKIQLAVWWAQKITQEINSMSDEDIEFTLNSQLPWWGEISDDILKEITDYIKTRKIEVNYNGFVTTGDGIHLIKKIELNFTGVSKDNVDVLIKRHFWDIEKVREFFMEMWNDIEEDINMLITLIEDEYKIIKNCNDLRLSVDSERIFTQIAKNIVPHQTTPFLRAGLAFVLFTFEYCFFGKKTWFEKISLFN